MHASSTDAEGVIEALLVLSAGEVHALLHDEQLDALREYLRERTKMEKTILMVMEPPFLGEVTQRFGEELSHARTLRQRLELWPTVGRWLAEEVQPAMRACQSLIKMDDFPMPLTTSLSAWEGGLTVCVRNFTAAFARYLGGDFFIQTPARLLLPEGRQVWRLPSNGGRERAPHLHVVSSCLLGHTLEEAARGRSVPANSTLLPPGDYSVIGLAAQAYATRKLLTLHSADLPAGLSRVIPSSMEVESFRLSLPSVAIRCDR